MEETDETDVNERDVDETDGESTTGRVAMPRSERRASRRDNPVVFKPRYVREQRLRRPYYWLSGR